MLKKIGSAVKSASSSIASGVRSVGREIQRTPSNVASAARSVGRETQRFVKSDLGKAALIAGTAYFGGTALMGAMGAGGSAAAGGAASGALGVSGGISSGAIASANAVAGASGAASAAGSAASGGLLSSLGSSASGAFSWLNNNPAAANLLGGTIQGLGSSMAERRNMSKMREHERDMLDRRREPRTEIGSIGNYGSHVGIARRGLLGRNMA